MVSDNQKNRKIVYEYFLKTHSVLQAKDQMKSFFTNKSKFDKKIINDLIKLTGDKKPKFKKLIISNNQIITE